MKFTCVPRTLIQSPLRPPDFTNCLVLSIDINTHGYTHTYAHIYSKTHVARSRSLISRAEIAYDRPECSQKGVT